MTKGISKKYPLCQALLFSELLKKPGLFCPMEKKNRRYESWKHNGRNVTKMSWFQIAVLPFTVSQWKVSRRLTVHAFWEARLGILVNENSHSRRQLGNKRGKYPMFIIQSINPTS